MSIVDLASLVSSIAVVATLVMLLLQIRQSNLNQKAMMQQGRVARISSQQMTSIAPEMAEVMSRANLSDLSLTPVQVRMINGFTQSFFWSLEDSFFQHRAGVLEKDSWAIDVATLRSALSLPTFRVGWRMTRAQTGGAFRDFIDAQLQEVKPRRDFQEAAIWKRLMEKELAAVEAGATVKAQG